MSSNVAVKLVAGAAAAVAIAGVVYYLFKESNNEAVVKADAEQNDLDISSDEFIAILERIISSQEECTEIVHSFSKELMKAEKKPSFLETYNMVKDKLPEDPIIAHGYTMHQFDMLIARFENHPQVTVLLERILRASSPPVNAEKSGRMKKKDIIEVYKFMLEHMNQIYEEFKQLLDEGFVADPKVTILAVQTIISAATEERFGLPSADVEAAAANNQRVLASDVEFARPSMMLQQLLASFMGSQLN